MHIQSKEEARMAWVLDVKVDDRRKAGEEDVDSVNHSRNESALIQQPRHSPGFLTLTKHCKSPRTMNPLSVSSFSAYCPGIPP